MPKARVGDINMYYEIHGEGEPLVYICGMIASLDWMTHLIPVFSPKYKLVLFDNRGAGRSDAPDIPYTTAMMADDLAGLLDAINIDSAHVRGASMGGMIAQEFALHYPERVKSLILECTSCGGQENKLEPEAAQAMEKMLELPAKEVLMTALRSSISQQFIDDNPDMIDGMVEQMMKHPVTPQGLKGQMGAVISHNTYERLPEIKAPTLVLHGEADAAFPVENARNIASRIPDAELVIFPNTGHMFIEAGDKPTKTILDFLRRHNYKE